MNKVLAQVGQFGLTVKVEVGRRYTAPGVMRFNSLPDGHRLTVNGVALPCVPATLIKGMTFCVEPIK